MRPEIIALDLARISGVAEGPIGEPPRFYTVQLAPRGADQDEIFAGAIKHIGGRLQAFRPSVVGWEEPELFRLRSGRATKATIEVLFGLPAVVGGVAQRLGIQHRSKVMANDIRRHFVGRSNMKRDEAKRLTIAECHRRGWMVTNDDEADACALHAFLSDVWSRRLPS